MKKKIITIAAIGSFVLLTTAYSIFSTEKNQVNSLMLENIEALASSEGGNEWESNYQYCRCKNSDAGIKECYSGNAISLRAQCGKSNVGTTLSCRNNSSECR